MTTHSYLGSIHDCSWWWDVVAGNSTRHFCGLKPGHDGPHICSCGKEQQ